MDSLHQKQDPKSQEYLDKKLEDQKINKEAVEVADTTSDARNIPPYDMSATTPQMAYPLDKIILKGEWDYLLDIYELSQAGGEVKPNVYPSFVCNRVHKLEHIKVGILVTCNFLSNVLENMICLVYDISESTAVISAMQT